MNLKGHGLFVGTKRRRVFGFEHAAFFIYNFFRVNGRLLSFLTFSKTFSQILLQKFLARPGECGGCCHGNHFVKTSWLKKNPFSKNTFFESLFSIFLTFLFQCITFAMDLLSGLSGIKFLNFVFVSVKQLGDSFIPLLSYKIYTDIRNTYVACVHLKTAPCQFPKQLFINVLQLFIKVLQPFIKIFQPFINNLSGGWTFFKTF